MSGSDKQSIFNRVPKIFLNQPSYKVFNKSFENEYDSLFLYLNEVDRSYLNSAMEDINYELLVDCRTNKEITQSVIDHTGKKNAIRPFFNAQRSNLTRAEHISCLRVLQAWRRREEVPQKDLAIWMKTVKDRESEKKMWHLKVSEYAQRERAVMYEPMQTLVCLYKKWYAERIKDLLNEVPHEQFKTHVGLPHINFCKGLHDEKAEMMIIELIEKQGDIYLWNGDKVPELNQLKYKLEYYYEVYINSNQNKVQPTQNKEILKPLEQHYIEIPQESLLFLLTAGDYVDLPTEMMLEIEQGHGNFKRFLFKYPFPARNCGWHTNLKVVEDAYTAFISVPNRANWLTVADNKITLLPNVDVPEIDAAKMINKLEYKPKKFENYLNENLGLYNQNANLRTNYAIVAWQLKYENDFNSEFLFHTRLQIPAVLDDKATKVLGCRSIKLEYKSQYGCELPTKYELLRDWLQLKLLKSQTGKRMRIAATNFSLLTDEEFCLIEIEQQLKSFYLVDISNLLSKLHAFLHLLINVAPGKYMLRYNYKYRDKLMLCEPTNSSSASVNLCGLLKTIPSDIVFNAEPGYLPIMDNLYSVVHLQYNLLPCAFQPGVIKRVVKPQELPKITPELERKLILNKAAKRKKDKIKQRLNKKKAQRRRRKTKKREAVQKQKSADEMSGWLMTDF